MKSDNPFKHYSLAKRVKKVKVNELRSYVKTKLPFTKSHGLICDYSFVFHHFHHPGRKNLIVKGQLGWTILPPGPPITSPELWANCMNSIFSPMLADNLMFGIAVYCCNVYPSRSANEGGIDR